MMISSFFAHYSGRRTFCSCGESAHSPFSPSFWQLPDIWEEKWRKSSSRRRELYSQTMWGTKPSVVLGSNFFTELSVKKSTAIVFLRPIVLFLSPKTPSMMGKPKRPRVIMQQWAFASSRMTPGKIITSRDALQNPQMAPPALSPELKTDLTNTISLKDIKSGENRKNGGKMKTSLAGPTDSEAVSSGREDSWVKQHHSWHHPGRAGRETAELAKQAPSRL